MIIHIPRMSRLNMHVLLGRRHKTGVMASDDLVKSLVDPLAISDGSGNAWKLGNGRRCDCM